MIRLDKNDIGRGVIYTPEGSGKKVLGVIDDFNEHYVFVRYGEEQFGSIATSASNLEWYPNKEKK